MAQNGNLHKAKAAKNDEFYTQLSDIEKELCHYTQHFKNKVVYCNCDNPSWSNFWRFFHEHFTEFGLRRLISTYYEKDGAPTYKTWYDGGNDKDITDWKREQLHGDGDFRSAECLAILDESDIVVTNPAFSLFREYVATLMNHDKKFIIWGNNNAITYKEIFPLLKENKIWLGYIVNKTCVFRLPENYERWDEKITRQINDNNKYGKVPAITVFTNLNIPKRHEKLILCKKYIPEEYPKYDNYAGINVNKVKDIPCDYYPCWYNCRKASDCQFAKSEGLRPDDHALCETPNNGCIGVPITYMDKHNPDQFTIIGATESEGRGFSNGLFDEGSKIKQPAIPAAENVGDKTRLKKNGSIRLYKRIFIRAKM